jgi:hypothetical protein
VNTSPLERVGTVAWEARSLIASRETGCELGVERVRPWMVRKSMPAAWTVWMKSMVCLFGNKRLAYSLFQ